MASTRNRRKVRRYDKMETFFGTKEYFNVSFFLSFFLYSWVCARRIRCAYFALPGHPFLFGVLVFIWYTLKIEF